MDPYVEYSMKQPDDLYFFTDLLYNLIISNYLPTHLLNNISSPLLSSCFNEQNEQVSVAPWLLAAPTILFKYIQTIILLLDVISDIPI